MPTNLVFADLDPALFSGDEFSARLAAEGVLVGGGQRPRFVTHYGITADDVDFALAAIGRVTAERADRCGRVAAGTSALTPALSQGERGLDCGLRGNDGLCKGLRWPLTRPGPGRCAGRAAAPLSGTA